MAEVIWDEGAVWGCWACGIWRKTKAVVVGKRKGW